MARGRFEFIFMKKKCTICSEFSFRICPHWESLAFSRDASLPGNGTYCSKCWSKEKLGLKQMGNLDCPLGKGQFIQNLLLWIPTWIYLDTLVSKTQAKSRKISLVLSVSVFSFPSFSSVFPFSCWCCFPSLPHYVW